MTSHAITSRKFGKPLSAPIAIALTASDPLANKAAQLLEQRIAERTGLAVRRTEREPADITLAITPELEPDAFGLEPRPNGSVLLRAGDGRGLITGVGALLRRSRMTPGELALTAWRGTDTPAKTWRGMYFATHFHNFYHTAPLEKIQRYVEDLALFGCNTLNVWLDLHHYAGINDPAAQIMIQRLRAILEAAGQVGIGAGLTTLANEGWSSTPQPLKASNATNENYFRSPGGFYHTEICPSQPGGLELILRNREETLNAFKGINFTNIWIWPYDQGGCTCTDCCPWGANGFLRTARAETALIKKHFPQAKIVLSTWLFDAFIKNEWEAFDQRLRQELPDWFDYLMIDDYTGFTEWIIQNGIPLNKPAVGFPEISMVGNHPWGGYGALPRPAHWADYWQKAGHLQDGCFPYSEGIFEDLSKFILLQLNRQPAREVAEIVREYCAAHFGEESVAEIVQACCLMEQNEGTGTFPLPPDDPGRAFINPHNWHKAEEVAAIMEAVDARLPDWARASWRWRILYLRAMIDRELKRSRGRHTPALNACFQELADMYHAIPDTTLECVMPPINPEFAFEK